MLDCHPCQMCCPLEIKLLLLLPNPVFRLIELKFILQKVLIIEPRLEKLVLAICEQQRCRSTCPAQSDQHLCCSLPRSIV